MLNPLIAMQKQGVFKDAALEFLQQSTAEVDIITEDTYLVPRVIVNQSVVFSSVSYQC